MSEYKGILPITIVVEYSNHMTDYELQKTKEVLENLTDNLKYIQGSEFDAEICTSVLAFAKETKWVIRDYTNVMSLKSVLDIEPLDGDPNYLKTLEDVIEKFEILNDMRRIRNTYGPWVIYICSSSGYLSREEVLQHGLKSNTLLKRTAKCAIAINENSDARVLIGNDEAVFNENNIGQLCDIIKKVYEIDVEDIEMADREPDMDMLADGKDIIKYIHEQIEFDTNWNDPWGCWEVDNSSNTEDNSSVDSGVECDRLYRDSTKALSVPIMYRDSTKALSVPIMLRNGTNDEIVDLVIDSRFRAHTVLSGAAGSGRISFLHTLISSIVQNYHPDDVELWLIDYSKISFGKYSLKSTKHIRLLALENTEEFTHSFLEYLEDYFNKRGQLFRNEYIENIEDYRARYGQLSMPRIVLIIDDFHIMAQHAKRSLAHNNILKNALISYRKFGLSCVFSDQVYSDELDEFTRVAANRIAMYDRNIQNVIDMLGVSKDYLPQNILHQMEQPQIGTLWYKSVDGSTSTVERFKSVYFNDEQQQSIFETSLRRNDDVKYDVNLYTEWNKGHHIDDAVSIDDWN